MRFIDSSNIELPPDWKKKSEELIEQLKTASNDERKKIIDRNSSHWKAMKKALALLSHEKCWYCEAKEDRSDYTVDHFRPKRRVAECADHEGYWWLAFDWENYRYSCTYCNSRRVSENSDGGKQDHFPLIDESCRAKLIDDDISLEQPLILDPLNPDDPTLLWFYITGEPVPKYSESENKIAYLRAKESIHVYHLDEERIQERRKEIYQTIRRTVAAANEALDDNAIATNDIVKERALHRFKVAAMELRDMISIEAEFSASARAYLLTFIDPTDSKLEWIQKLLDRTE